MACIAYMALGAQSCTKPVLIERRYAELVYNGFWFSPEREMLQASIDASQKYVSGTVRLKLYKVLTTPLNSFVGTQYQKTCLVYLGTIYRKCICSL